VLEFFQQALLAVISPEQFPMPSLIPCTDT
jgi:hypothetical protein